MEGTHHYFDSLSEVFAHFAHLYSQILSCTLSCWKLEYDIDKKHSPRRENSHISISNSLNHVGTRLQYFKFGSESKNVWNITHEDVYGKTLRQYVQEIYR